MYDALVNIFNTIIQSIIIPFKNALNETKLIDPIRNFANGLLGNFFRLWNDNNLIKSDISNDLIAYIIGLIVLVIIIEIVYAIFRIVFTAFETIEKNINSFDNKQRWKKRGGHKKK